MKRLLLIFGLVLIFQCSPCRGQLTSDVLRRVLQIEATQGGTAFTIEVDGKQYLVTAKHIVSGLPDKEESKIKIHRKNGWKDLSVTIFKCEDPVDIAVLVPKAQQTVNYDLEPTSVGLAIGQDAYFVGFPYGAAVTYNSLPDMFGHAKRATISAFIRYPEQKAQVIELDGYNNQGFSGAPLIWRDFSKPGLVYKVAGVMVSFAYDATKILKIKEEVPEANVKPEDLSRGDVIRSISDGRYYRVEETNQLVKLNTGIAAAWDIGSAVELIHQHPNGPKATDDFAEGQP